MMNIIWVGMIIAGILFAAFTGRIEAVTPALMSGAEQAITLAIALLAILAFWVGIARIAEKAGLMKLLARLLGPLLRPIFPSLRPGHPAFSFIVMNVAANLLGLGNAATPLGLKAMQHMQEENRDSEEATDAMCTFLALNTSGLALVPATVIGLRAAYGSTRPAAIVGVTFLASLTATIVGLLVDRLLRRAKKRRR